jgi:hypothetical protein
MWRWITILCLTLAALTVTLVPASHVNAKEDCDPKPCAIQEPGGN